MIDFIYSLKAKDIIDRAEPGTYHPRDYDPSSLEDDSPSRTVFRIDLTDLGRFQPSKIEISVNGNAGAFWYQLKNEVGSTIPLNQKAIIVDFDRYFSKKEIKYTSSYKMDTIDYGDPWDPLRKEYNPDASQRLRDFFINSRIIIRFDENTEYEFTVFDKSSSMARHSRITLLNKELLCNTRVVSYVFNMPPLKSRKQINDYLDSIRVGELGEFLDPYNPINHTFTEDILLLILKTKYSRGEDESIIRVNLPDKVKNIQANKELFSSERKIQKYNYDYDGSDFETSIFLPLVESPYSNHIYYVESKLWNRIKGDDSKAKLNTLYDDILSYQKKYLNLRLNLGIDFHGIDLSFSKFYAYRGLYLSDSKRIAKIDLNEDTVIVLPDKLPNSSKHYDDYCYSKKVICIHNTEEQATDSEEEVDFKKEKWELKNDPMFDGEGLISPDYAKKINKELKTKANSFQIRMPFIKGIVHNVDFQDFLNKYAKGYTTCLDFFGIKRDLSKAKIILTESMFKAGGWLKELWDKDKTLRSGEVVKDPMKFFFDRMKVFKHALYISGTDSSFQKSDLVQMNYQILSTLDITYDELYKLVEDHWYYIENPIDYLIRHDSVSEYKWRDNDGIGIDTGVEEYDISDCSNSWIEVLQADRMFQYHPYIKQQLTNCGRRLKEKIAFGRLIVPGENRYLSRDLLLFLKYLIELSYSSNDKNKDIDDLLENKDSIINTELLMEDQTYIPCDNIELIDGNYYPIFRNPHLSRNEECVLKASIPTSKESIRVKYLGHLSGVLMVSGKSFVPKILGGADFDGDPVKIINSEPITNAVLRGSYYKNKNRKLPIVDIVPFHPKKEPYKDSIDYKTLFDTFTERIGIISNRATKTSESYYIGKKNNLRDPAEYTILTGLEIDAAKTGTRPKLDAKMINDFYINNFLNPIKEVKSRHNAEWVCLPAKKHIFEDKESRKITVKSSNGSRGYYAPAPSEESSTLSNLAYLYLYGCKSDQLPLESSTKISQIRESCNKLPPEAFDLNNDALNIKIPEDLIKDGKRILDKIPKDKSLRNHGSCEKYIKEVLSYRSEADPDKCISDMHDALAKCLKTQEAVFNARKKLRSSDWPYLYEFDDKKKRLAHILGTKVEDLPQLLQNEDACIYKFSGYGYNLFYLFLRDLNIDDSPSDTKTVQDTKVVIENLKKVAKDNKIPFFPFLYSISNMGRDPLFWQAFSAKDIIWGIRLFTNIKDYEKEY